MSTTVPLAVDLAPQRLRLQWPDGTTDLPAAVLRAACRCGPCRARALRGDTPATDGVQLTDAAPIGQYALQLVFSDGHDRGIYPWLLLHDLSTAMA